MIRLCGFRLINRLLRTGLSTGPNQAGKPEIQDGLLYHLFYC